MSAPAYAGATHPGLARDQNQDAIHLPSRDAGQDLVFILADGMGGASGGQVASRLAVEAVSQSLGHGALAQPRQALEQAVRQASEALAQAARGRPELQGMGTTLVVLLLAGMRAWLANVGDSRCYLWRQGLLEQVTQDHSLVRRLVLQGSILPEEARRHPLRNVLTRVVGAAGPVEADIYNLELWPGDALLMCSDGLHGPVEEGDLATVLAGPGPPADKVTQLINLANRRGGPDNISAILVEL